MTNFGVSRSDEGISGEEEFAGLHKNSWGQWQAGRGASRWSFYISELQQRLLLAPYEMGILCAVISGVDFHPRSLAVQHIVNGACQNPACM